MTFCFAYSVSSRDCVFLLESAQVIDVIVVIADRDREDLFRFVLFDHETVEMRLDVARQKIENELVVALLAGFSSLSASARSGWVKVAKETLSPKFDFMNSESFALVLPAKEMAGFVHGRCARRCRARNADLSTPKRLRRQHPGIRSKKNRGQKCAAVREFFCPSRDTSAARKNLIEIGQHFLRSQVFFTCVRVRHNLAAGIAQNEIGNPIAGVFVDRRLVRDLLEIDRGPGHLRFFQSKSRLPKLRSIVAHEDNFELRVYSARRDYNNPRVVA